MKIKYFIVLFVIGLAIFSCNKDDDENDNFDAEAQAVIDNDALISYLQTHYLNEEDGGLWTIENGESSLMDDVRLKSQTIEKNDINYTLYYLKQFEGSGDIFPTRADSVLVTYTGMKLDSVVFDSASNIVWLPLTSVIDGWSYGFEHFKGGELKLNDDESFYYENSGKGILFIPSGLAYGNITQTLIPENSPLIFEIDLKAVKQTDHDTDGILSIDEDIDNDGDVRNDDTDGDLIPNYLDADDDGDGILTKDELEDGKYLDPNN
ncbi:FKBP-type peptidyl-prolyl cis-trans isomerase [uncultured Lutibacter sp.]|uniref:FKBP-type peptidyl-prolyl cis-trans isomerase n=1 Tax=uncultured Lutibacter sp. TaxID=437739 RepID=UPI002619233B|nr:FKBP-type peptidyl-prolyl cis-trans isomerase [uncultured Lutibacter sp.]